MKNWMRLTLYLAGAYNFIWGGWVIAFPNMAFHLTGARLPSYPEIWQCVGMIVGVYGLGYIVAAKNPIKHWPIVLVGFLGKILGPIGFLGAIHQDVFPLAFGVTIIFNDLIWWIPFGLILNCAYQAHSCGIATHSVSEEEFKAYPSRKRAQFINSLSGVKAPNLVGTISAHGQTNLSIVSSVFHLGSEPALIGMILRPDTVKRDTLENIRATKHYTLNHVTQEIFERAHQTSARYPSEVCEFKATGLTKDYLGDCVAPFVDESPIKLEVRLVREITIQENGTHLIIGQIKQVHLPKDCLEKDGRVNITKAGSIGLSGLDTYLDPSPIARLSYAKPDRELTHL